MDNKIFRFQVGKFVCIVVSDGELTLTDRSKPPAGQNTTPPVHIMDVLSLFINTGEHKVLVDTGFGTAENPDLGHLLQNLHTAGIKPTEIDTVIHSHLHVDHIGGNVDSRGKSIYPNARHIVNTTEWEFWKTMLGQKQVEPGLIQSTVTALKKNIIPIQNRVKLVDDEAEIVPGIKSILAPGHTPGNIVLELSSGSGQLILIGDLLHLPVELTQPDLFRHIDEAHDLAVLTRNRILSEAAREGTMVFAGHFPFPGLGHIYQRGDIMQWQPLELTCP